MMHELEVAIGAGALGSIDANTGDYLLGWDTDQFPTNIYLTTQCMYCILNMGGFTTGGVNFDAKVRRESFEPIDLFYAHIGGMDTFARGLKIAHAIITDGRLGEFIKERYQSWDCEPGRRLESGQCNLADMEAYILPKGDAAKNKSGRQEMLENLINEFI
jgi:xylose isomerase